MSARSVFAKLMLVVAAVLFLRLSLPAQIAAPNDAGVSMGAVTLNVSDVAASVRFWEEVGATRVSKGKLTAMEMPGAILILQQSDNPQPSVGSAINHIGLSVKDGKVFFDMLRAKGLKVEPTALGCAGAPLHNCGFGYTKEGVKIETFEDAGMPTSVRFHHIHFFTQAPPSTKDMQAWYAKYFGGIPGFAGSAGTTDADTLPGVSLRFNPSDTAVVSPTGRAVDHIGFEVKGLQAFCEKLKAQGLQLSVPYRHGMDLATASVVDPAGVTVELTEGLSKF